MPRARFILTIGLLMICTMLAVIGTIIPTKAAAQSSNSAANGKYVFERSWGGEGDTIRSPTAVAIGSNNVIYIANKESNRITAITPGDRIYHSWTTSGLDGTQKAYLIGIAVDSHGDVYITDGGRNLVQKFTGDGRFLTQWGKEAVEDGLFNPVRLTVDNNDNILIADMAADRILKFTNNGTYLGQFGSEGKENGMFDAPTDVAVDSKGNIYVTDTLNNRIQKFNSDGAYIKHWYNNFYLPQGVAVDKDDNVFVADSSRHRIQKFTSDGDVLAVWGREGSDEGEFNYPFGIAVDKYGKVYVGDTDNNRVQKFSGAGDYLVTYGVDAGLEGQINYPQDLAVGENGDIYELVSGSFVAGDTLLHRVQHFSSDGTLLNHWGSYGRGEGQFAYPSGITANSTGEVSVVERGSLFSGAGGRAQTFSSEGDFVREWASKGEGEGELSLPSGIAAGADGHLFVCDNGNNRVQKFTSGGAFLALWGEEGTGDGQFHYPDGIAAAPNGDVYVWDRIYDPEDGVSRIQRFSSNGEYKSQWENHIFDLTVDSQGNVFQVTDKVQQLTADGALVTEWGEYGGGPGQFNKPWAIAVAGSGDLYVADLWNSRIQKFTKQLPAPDPVSGLIQNGSFENRPNYDGWTAGGSLPLKVNQSMLHQTGSVLQLGEAVSQDEQEIGQAWSHQTLFVPDNWSNPALYFKYRIQTNDIIDYSDFFVTIQDGVGVNHLETVLRAGYPSGQYAPPEAYDLGWQEVRFDLSTYKGQYIRVVFNNRNLWPESLGIWTELDDVRLVEADQLPPPPSYIYMPLSIAYTGDLLNVVEVERIERPSVP